MFRHQLRAFAAIASCLCLVSACETDEESPDPKNEGGPVTFELHVAQATTAFLADGTVSIRIWDSEQLAIKDATAECSVSSTGETSCPEGVTYAEPKPEVFQSTPAALEAGASFESATVTVGETYELSLSGTAEDDCNTTSGQHAGKAKESSVVITDPELATTMMACQ